jgi:hypothetical protein
MKKSISSKIKKINEKKQTKSISNMTSKFYDFDEQNEGFIQKYPGIIHFKKYFESSVASMRASPTLVALAREDLDISTCFDSSLDEYDQPSSINCSYDENDYVSSANPSMDDSDNFNILEFLGEEIL